MIKAIFFDQDNTILATKKVAGEAYKLAINKVARDFKLEFEELYIKWQEEVEKIKFSTDPKLRFLDYSLGKVFEFYNIDKSSLDNYVEQFQEDYISKIELTSGTKEFLESENTLIKIMFTEDNEIQNKLKRDKFQLEKYFDLIINSDMTGIMKPNIKYLEIGWKQFNLKPEECIYVGDNWEKDCKMGQELGGIGVVFGSMDERANFEIENMMELVEILRSLDA